MSSSKDDMSQHTCAGRVRGTFGAGPRQALPPPFLPGRPPRSPSPCRPRMLVLRQVLRFARLPPRAEQKLPVQPQAPDHHGMRRAVRLDGRYPVIVAFLQAVFSPLPRKEALLAFRQSISRHVRAAGFGCWFGWRLGSWQGGPPARHWMLIRSLGPSRLPPEGMFAGCWEHCR
jgi:hypothetical protein